MRFIKNLVKCSLDQCVVPGTRTATEILWLYMIQWKREMANITTGSFNMFLSQRDLPMVADSSAPEEQPKSEG